MDGAEIEALRKTLPREEFLAALRAHALAVNRRRFHEALESIASRYGLAWRRESETSGRMVAVDGGESRSFEWRNAKWHMDLDLTRDFAAEIRRIAPGGAKQASPEAPAPVQQEKSNGMHNQEGG